jgi:hypothetical protein
MSKLPRFAAYAAAFEEAFASDDWSGVEPFLTPDASYEADLPAGFGGRFEGRTAVVDYFKRILDGFDRRFEKREATLVEGPREEGDVVSFRFSVRYQAPGRPALEFEGAETLRFDGDAIVELADRYDANAIATVEAYVREHGAPLGLGLA